MTNISTPRHCGRCNHMSLGDWRAHSNPRPMYECPICKHLVSELGYAETAPRAADHLARQRPAAAQ